MYFGNNKKRNAAKYNKLNSKRSNPSCTSYYCINYKNYYYFLIIFFFRKKKKIIDKVVVIPVLPITYTLLSNTDKVEPQLNPYQPNLINYNYNYNCKKI